MLRKIYFFVIVGLIFVTGVVKGEKKESENKKSTTVKIPAQLKRDGILVTNKAYKQIFQAYIENPRPFITSDSLLNAYHVLFEESIRNLEKRQAVLLRKLVYSLYKKLEDKKINEEFFFTQKLFHQAVQRDKLVIGIALKLFEPDFKLEDSMLNKLAEIEITKINKAKGISMPEWLGKSSEDFTGIDYSRFKVRSFYSKSECLKRFFKATAWLQAVPFKVKKDVDLLAFMILQQCWYALTSDYHIKPKYYNYFKPYSQLLGKQDGVGITSSLKKRNVYNENDLKSYRKKLLNSKKTSLINDSIRFTHLSKVGIEELRILPARRTPSAILFSFTTDTRLVRQTFPNGLEVCALLGSNFATKQLTEDVKKIIKKKKNLISSNNYTLYERYLNTLKTLFNNKHNSIPAFMKTKSWKIKSCNTVLGAWAQMRHTWALQAKQNAQYLCVIEGDSGFVEPSVEFWGHMAKLCELTRRTLNLKYDSTEDLVLFKKLSVLLQKESLTTIRNKYPEMLRISDTAYYAVNFLNGHKYISDQAKKREKNISALKKIITILESNTLHEYPQLEKIFDRNKYELNELWIKLQNICLQLQAIALKQLSNIPRSKYEKRFIADYGTMLGKIMLYNGNSYMSPKDDAPRIVDVFTDVNETGIRYLEVGIGRAREILVLYPTPKGKVLCKGAILPYYEFFSNKRLTDKEWGGMLDSNAKRPAIPKWLRPIVKSGKLKTAVIKRRY